MKSREATPSSPPVGVATVLSVAWRFGRAFITAKYKDRAYVESSLTAGPESDRTAALITAAKAGDVRGAGRCLVGGCDVNATDKQTGKTPLMLACEGGSLPTIELIANNGSDLLMKDVRASFAQPLIPTPHSHFALT